MTSGLIQILYFLWLMRKMMWFSCDFFKNCNLSCFKAFFFLSLNSVKWQRNYWNCWNLLVYKDKLMKFTEYTLKQDGKNSVISLSLSSLVWKVCQKTDYLDTFQMSAKWCFQLHFRNISWEHSWLKCLCPNAL